MSNIYLVGYRATGKSTLAPKIARKLGDPWTACDLDVEIERRAGMSIPEIFATQGEPGFRDLESATLAEFSTQSHLVFATGGGVVERPENRTLLAQEWVVWLSARVETLVGRLSRRTAGNDNRPALTNLDLRDEIQTVLDRRTPWYQELSQLTISTDLYNRSTVISTIVSAYEKSQGRLGEPPAKDA